MSEFISKCPHCQLTLTANESLVGKTVQCPNCQRKFLLNLDITSPQRMEFYSPTIAAMWSLLFTPLFGAWCFLQNCFRFVHETEIRKNGLLFFLLNIYFFISWIGVVITQCRDVFQEGKTVWNGITSLISLLNFLIQFIWHVWLWHEVSKHEDLLKSHGVKNKNASFLPPVLTSLVLLVMFVIIFAVSIRN